MKIDHAKLWEEGRYIDLWTIPHLLAGVVLCGLLNWLGADFWLNLAISSLLIIIWEFFEYYALNVHEYFSNNISDIVCGWLGFIIMYGFIIKYTISIVLPYLLITTVIYLGLNAWGFMAYKRRKLEAE